MDLEYEMPNNELNLALASHWHEIGGEILI